MGEKFDLHGCRHTFGQIAIEMKYICYDLIRITGYSVRLL